MLIYIYICVYTHAYIHIDLYFYSTLLYSDQPLTYADQLRRVLGRCVGFVLRRCLLSWRSLKEVGLNRISSRFKGCLFFVELCCCLASVCFFFFLKVLRWYLRRYWCLWWCQSWWIRCWDNARWDVFSTISKKNICQLFCVPKLTYEGLEYFEPMSVCEQWQESWLFRVFGDEILPSCIRIIINRSKDLYQSTRIQRKESGRVLFFSRGSAVVLQTLMCSSGSLRLNGSAKSSDLIMLAREMKRFQVG